MSAPAPIDVATVTDANSYLATLDGEWRVEVHNGEFKLTRKQTKKNATTRREYVGHYKTIAAAILRASPYRSYKQSDAAYERFVIREKWGGGYRSRT